MNEEKLIEEIKESINDNKNFLRLWNSIFPEEKVSAIESKKHKDDILELLIEEIEYFELSKLQIIYKFIDSKM